MKATVTLLAALGLAAPQVLAADQSMDSQQMPGKSGMSRQSQYPSSGGASGDQERRQSGMGMGQDHGGMGMSGDSRSNPSSDVSSGAGGRGQSQSGMGSQQDASYPDHPTPVSQNDVTYLCGGVGNKEQTYMKEQARSYDMMLTFATRKGSYLADVDVDIKDARGNDVLQANCDGPMMLIDLPKAGTYKVRAETAGYSLNRTVRVASAKGGSQRIARAVMTWPQQVAEGPRAETTSSGSSGQTRGRSDSSGSGAR